MVYLRVDRQVNPGFSPVCLTGGGHGDRVPQLSVPRAGWGKQFVSSALALLRGPIPPKEFLGAPFFRDCWIEARFPKLAFLAAIATQVLFVLYPPPIWNVRPPRGDSSSSQMELTWYGPVNDLPSIVPHRAAPGPPPSSKPRNSALLSGADAFRPRQTILSEPLHPTHPRQTLLQPQAPPEPPKILPVLPNLLQLAGSELAMPKIELSREQFQQLRPKMPAPLKVANAVAPNVSVPPKRIDLLSLASSQTVPKPALPVMPMSAPQTVSAKHGSGIAIPHVALAAPGGPVTLIALSANSPPIPPPPEVPPGNLSARFSISPEGQKPGSPVSAAPDRASPGGSLTGRGPEGIFIGGGNPPNGAPSSKLNIGAATRIPIDALPSRPIPRVTIPSSGSMPHSFDPRPAALAPGAPPEAILGSKRIYRLLVNMPNLTSATGSWVLNFAEMDDMDEAIHPQSGVPELTGPVPLRKVDPKYPPELRAAHVEGEVVLYAVIRKDGSVDSIQLVSGPDPQLDTNAMEALAQWKFKPAEINGVPVALEAVVHVPFRSRAPDSY